MTDGSKLKCWACGNLKYFFSDNYSKVCLTIKCIGVWATITTVCVINGASTVSAQMMSMYEEKKEASSDRTYAADSLLSHSLMSCHMK